MYGIKAVKLVLFTHQLLKILHAKVVKQEKS